MAQHYELAIIGSGSGGREAALLGARKGLRTAIIERDRLGGTCFHRGSYAVRALQACARQFRDSWKSGRFGNKIDLMNATLKDWINAQRLLASRLTDNFQAELGRLHVDLIQANGELLDHRTIRLVDRSGSMSTVTAEDVIVATGSRPAFSDSSRPRMVNSDQLLGIVGLPERLAIVGAGYVGCEFASIYRSLGTEVTLIEQANRILPGWESEAADRVAEKLEIRGVPILLNCKVALENVRESETDVIIPLHAREPVVADLVLIATGRRPNAEGLGLSELGVDDSSSLRVDSSMRLSAPGLYGVGDVTGLSLLDSTAFSQATVAINSVLGLESNYDPRWIPRCVHTEPAIAAVGWTQGEAISHGFECVPAAADLRLTSDDERSVIDPEPTYLKVLVDPRSRKLLGCLVAGDHAAVIANVAAIAIHLGASIDQLREIPLAQPSAADALMATLRTL